MKNPKWHRDEIILALDLYFDPKRGSIDAKNPKIIELSELLNSLPIFEIRPDQEKFRNPNGVTLKLSNFLAIDPSYEGKGMDAYSKLDEDIFNEFKDDQKGLRRLATEIKAISRNPSLRKEISNVEDDETASDDSVKEGQVLYKLHKVRERDRKIIEAKKKKALRELGKLACEVCGFDFKNTYGSIGVGFIECHHIVPLSNFESTKKTVLQDLALVCANCHRMLHRSMSILSINDLRETVGSIRLT
jgi:5-methylcytosine-specific restriction protein A